MSNAFAQPADIYLQHFIRHFGKPFDIEAYRTEDGERLRIAVFDLRYKQFKIYATLGLSDAPDMPDLGEVILLTDDFRPDVKQLFVHFMLFVLQKNIPLGSRFCIGGIEMINNDFADFYGKQALYVMPAEGFGAGFEELECEEETGKVYQGLFVSYTEQDMIRRQGGEAFEQKLRDQSKAEELCSLKRPSVVG